MSGKHAEPSRGWFARRRDRKQERKLQSDRKADDALLEFRKAYAPAADEAGAHAATTQLSVADIEAFEPEAEVEKEHPRLRKRHLVLGGVVGVGLAGAALVGMVAWVSVGAGVVKPDSNASVTSKLRDDWKNDRLAMQKEYIGIIRIPRFGEKWEFPIARGTSLSVLAAGAGWDTEGAKPGEIGNVVVSAHRVTHNAPFHDFPELRVGDVVEIETMDKTYTYKMMDSGNANVVKDNTQWPLWPIPDPTAEAKEPTDRLLTLITCAKLFHTDKRLVARAQQVDVQTKPSTT